MARTDDDETGFGYTDFSSEPGHQTLEEVRRDGRSPVRLADLLYQLGAELREADRRARADGHPDSMRVKDCSIEVGITWEASGEGEVGGKFLAFKLGGKLSRSNTQTITLNLEPIPEGEEGLGRIVFAQAPLRIDRLGQPSE